MNNINLPPEELKYWHCLAMIKEIGPKTYQKLYNYFSSTTAVWQASLSNMQKAGIRATTAYAISKSKAELTPDIEWQKLQKLNIKVITIKDDKFSKQLREIYEPPFLLYYKGNIELLNQTSLAVVGTRKITAYGQQVVPKIVAPLVAQNITIVSGLALGIDALAHQTCINNNGSTIAVLGSGLDQIYPASNRYLAEKIINTGLIISEYPPGTPPLKHHFPYRNRIISGLCLGTIVIEGNEDSGSLITAKYALDQNREIFAVPGNILAQYSTGTNKLIKMGAKLITSTEDIFEELNIEQTKQFNQAQKVIADNKEEEIILNILSNEPLHVNDIIKQVQLDVATTNSTLSLMEIKGKIKNLGGSNYVINS